MTSDILKKCMPSALLENIEKFSEPLTHAMELFQINNHKRQAAFLAQIAHESGSLRYVREIATGDAYEGRKDLGNTEAGDGIKFKGRGLIQITGKSNYKAVGEALDFDFVKDPSKLELPGAASMSAGWFWQTHGLNELADIDDFEKITKRINGGLNGYEDRLKNWERIKLILS